MNHPTVEQPTGDPSCAKALICAHAAIDKKSENVKVLNLTGISRASPIISSSAAACLTARSRRSPTRSNASSKPRVGEVLSIEGYAEGRWVLMDCGDVVVHIFLDALREYYDLEALWADAPRVKIPSEFYGPAASRLN